MGARIIQGSVFDRLPELAAGSVDVCCCSPPYWALRSYLPAGHEQKALELGSEPIPDCGRRRKPGGRLCGQCYICNQLAVMRLVRRVLVDWGTVWINCGDTFSSGHSGESGLAAWGAEHARGGGHSDGKAKVKRAPPPGIPAGNLCLIPWRLALALQADGWIVRSVVCWAKAAPMPQSLSGWRWQKCRVKVKGYSSPKRKEQGRTGTLPQRDGGYCMDVQMAEYKDCPGCHRCLPNGGLVLRRGSWRCTSSWEPILMLAKSANYFADGESVKTPSAAATVSRNQYTRILDDPDEQFACRHDHETTTAGANLRDVWNIAAQPLSCGICTAADCRWFTPDGKGCLTLTDAATGQRHKHCPRCRARMVFHYAAFPEELVRRCLQASTSARGNCGACGRPWVRVVETTTNGEWKECPKDAGRRSQGLQSDVSGLHSQYFDKDTRTLAWRPSCQCLGAADTDPVAPTVLDCYCGSGRTGLAALKLGLNFVGVELSEEYCRIAERLLRDSSPLFSGLE